MKILVVEDNSAMSQKIIEMVTKPGDIVIPCSTSSQVIHLYEEHRPDIVLMDIRIKPLNGVKTTKVLKNLYPEARVIMLTSHDEPEYHEAARHAGASGYMLKENLVKVRNFIDVLTRPARWIVNPTHYIAGAEHV